MHIGDEMENKEQFQEIAIRIGFDIYEEDGEFFYAETRMAYELFQAMKSQATPEGFVLVPRECPDPIFADKLFDHLCKKAHGEFGDDQMIFFSDIDESAIWQLMIEAQEQSHDNSN